MEEGSNTGGDDGKESPTTTVVFNMYIELHLGGKTWGPINRAVMQEGTWQNWDQEVEANCQEYLKKLLEGDTLDRGTVDDMFSFLKDWLKKDYDHQWRFRMFFGILNLMMQEGVATERRRQLAGLLIELWRAEKTWDYYGTPCSLLPCISIAKDCLLAQTDEEVQLLLLELLSIPESCPDHYGIWDILHQYALSHADIDQLCAGSLLALHRRMRLGIGNALILDSICSSLKTFWKQNRSSFGPYTTFALATLLCTYSEVEEDDDTIDAVLGIFEETTPPSTTHEELWRKASPSLVRMLLRRHQPFWKDEKNNKDTKKDKEKETTEDACITDEGVSASFSDIDWHKECMLSINSYPLISKRELVTHTIVSRIHRTQEPTKREKLMRVLLESAFFVGMPNKGSSQLSVSHLSKQQQDVLHILSSAPFAAYWDDGTLASTLSTFNLPFSSAQELSDWMEQSKELNPRKCYPLDGLFAYDWRKRRKLPATGSMDAAMGLLYCLSSSAEKRKHGFNKLMEDSIHEDYGNAPTLTPIAPVVCKWLLRILDYRHGKLKSAIMKRLIESVSKDRWRSYCFFESLIEPPESGGIAQEVLSTVREGYPIFLELLQHHSPKTRCLAAYLLSMFPEQSDSVTVSELFAAFHLSKELQVKASCLLALIFILPHLERQYDHNAILAFCRDLIETKKKIPSLKQRCADVILAQQLPHESLSEDLGAYLQQISNSPKPGSVEHNFLRLTAACALWRHHLRSQRHSLLQEQHNQDAVRSAQQFWDSPGGMTPLEEEYFRSDVLIRLHPDIESVMRVFVDVLGAFIPKYRLPDESSLFAFDEAKNPYYISFPWNHINNTIAICDWLAHYLLEPASSYLEEQMELHLHDPGNAERLMELLNAYVQLHTGDQTHKGMMGRIAGDAEESYTNPWPPSDLLAVQWAVRCKILWEDEAYKRKVQLLIRKASRLLFYPTLEGLQNSLP